MAAISRIKAGQTLYTVTRQLMGNTTIRQSVVHPVLVKEVDTAGRYVIASWNGNPPRKFGETAVSKWKVKRPELKDLPLPR